MISWKLVAALIFIIVCCLSSPSAHAQDNGLQEFTCVPSTCKDINFGFQGTSQSRVTVAGLCTNGFEPFASVTITALNCSFEVETEAEGSSTSTLQDDGCGNLIVIGEVDANGSVFNAITQVRLAFVGSSQDCTGLEAGAPTVQAC